MSNETNVKAKSIFTRAERKQVPLKIGITGPAGSGKTMSALLIAEGIAEVEKSRIALIDTEKCSASLYSDRFDFDICEIDPPYSVDKYIDGIKRALEAGYKILIIDTISHAWSGEGGLLQQKEMLDAHKGNQFANWAPITKMQEQFIAKILHSDIHIITTMRSKTEYILVDDGGKQKPKKVGLAPVQRDGIEYEFTTVFDLSMNHTAEVSKDRTNLFDGKIFKPTKETGLTLIDWIKDGKNVSKKEESSSPYPQGDHKKAMEAIGKLKSLVDLVKFKNTRDKRSWSAEELNEQNKKLSEIESCIKAELKKDLPKAKEA